MLGTRSAALGMDATELPLHLRTYGLQLRNAEAFSGPGLLPCEEAAGRVRDGREGGREG